MGRFSCCIILDIDENQLSTRSWSVCGVCLSAPSGNVACFALTPVSALACRCTPRRPSERCQAMCPWYQTPHLEPCFNHRCAVCGDARDSLTEMEQELERARAAQRVVQCEASRLQQVLRSCEEARASVQGDAVLWRGVSSWC